MPVPKPAKDESKDKFMSRCMSFMNKENSNKSDKDKWTREQMAAICYSQWGKKQKAAISDEERETNEEFVKRFVTKYPKYRKHFERALEDAFEEEIV